MWSLMRYTVLCSLATGERALSEKCWKLNRNDGDCLEFSSHSFVALMKQKIPNYCAIDLYYEYVIFTIKYQPAAPSAAFSNSKVRLFSGAKSFHDSLQTFILKNSSL
jgi:hypothetical protein